MVDFTSTSETPKPVPGSLGKQTPGVSPPSSGRRSDIGRALDELATRTSQDNAERAAKRYEQWRRKD